MNKRILIILIAAFVVLKSSAGFAADSLSKKIPSAVLVQLNTEQNRIKKLTEAGDMVAVREVEKDAKGVSTAMISDFTDHFSYCPVYYFLDINLDKIKARNFEGVLMNADGTPVVHPVISNTSTDYLIVYYGFPPIQKAAPKIGAEDRFSTRTLHKGLVICNYKMQQVRFFVRQGFELMFSGKKRKYKYSSSHYDIDYVPLVQDFQQKLDENQFQVITRD